MDSHVHNGFKSYDSTNSFHKLRSPPAGRRKSTGPNQNLKNDNENSTFSTYRTTQFNVETFETEMVTVVDTVSNEIDRNCAMIPLWKQVCTDDESKCQLADIDIQTSENSIIISTQALVTLYGVCELSLIHI